MSQTIVIDPVTRIEGHARVLIELNDDNTVQSAGLVVNELRGFERILVGMEADRMPQVTARICGVCPSAHHLAAVKALENGLGVTPPPGGLLARELFYMGHVIHSHAAHLFALSGPDLVFGIDADPSKRNIVGIVEANPEFAKNALRLRTLGQKINERIGGRGIHPVCAVIGGMAWQIKEADQSILQKMAEECLSLIQQLFEPTKELLVKELERKPALAEVLVHPTYYLGTVKDDKLNFYDGVLRLIDDHGTLVREFDATDYETYLIEKPYSWSYMKPVFIKGNGADDQVYRVSTLARINCAGGMETPLAQREFETFRSAYGVPCHLTVMQIYARLIETLYACEKAVALASDPELTQTSRVEVKMRAGRGVGHVEAPRGTLIHDYEFDDKGVVRGVNLIVATQQNYAAINESIKQSVGEFVAGKGDNALLNAAEFAIRCYDPCLSCATHAWGRMPLDVSVTKNGQLVRHLRRSI